MKYYIVKENEKLRILKVTPDKEESFHQEYKGKVIASGSSLYEVITQLHKIEKGE